MIPRPTVAIVVLNWNGWRDTLACLRSLTALTYPNAWVMVVDNGSTDESVAMIGRTHPEVELISVTGRSAAGQKLGAVFPHLSHLGLTVEQARQLHAGVAGNVDNADLCSAHFSIIQEWLQISAP